jgi:hypothetical protein
LVPAIIAAFIPPIDVPAIISSLIPHFLIDLKSPQPNAPNEPPPCNINTFSIPLVFLIPETKSTYMM